MPGPKKGSTYQRASRPLVARLRTEVWIGDCYGKLVVEEELGLRPIGKRRTLWWLCRCDCGETIELPTLKLRGPNPKPLWTTCETCSQKTCCLCGDKYPRSRRYDFCASPACVEVMARDSQVKKQIRIKQRRKDDAEWRDEINRRQRERNARWEGKISKTWTWVQNMSPERRAQFEEKRLTRQRAYYDKIYNDPVLYKAWREKKRPAEIASKLRAAQSAYLQAGQELSKSNESES